MKNNTVMHFNKQHTVCENVKKLNKQITFVL